MRISIKTAFVLLAAIFLVNCPVHGLQKERKPQIWKKPAVKQARDSAAVKWTPAGYGKYNFTLKTIDEQTVKLSDYSGKVVLVNIWAPWCKPCSTEVPGIIRLFNRYKAMGFEVIGVAVQTNESDVRSFIERLKVPWVIGIKDNITKAYNSYGLPDSYLFRRDGTLLREFIGFTHEEVLKPLIEAALKEIPPKPRP